MYVIYKVRMTSDSWTSNKLCSPATNWEVGMVSLSQPKVPQLAQTPAEPGRSLAEASAFLHLFYVLWIGAHHPFFIFLHPLKKRRVKAPPGCLHHQTNALRSHEALVEYICRLLLFSTQNFYEGIQMLQLTFRVEFTEYCCKSIVNFL